MLGWLSLHVGLALAAPSAEVAITRTAERARPAVVHVQVAQGTSWTPVLQDLLIDFQIPPRARARSSDRATGSAFFVSADGRALTNHHVVAGATEVTVVLHDQRRFPARVLGTDPRTDLAVLQVDTGDPLPFLPMGDSSKLSIGQIVLAVGSPFDFASTTTLGIVSYLGRRGLDSREIQDYIQTDAAVNPGNSGGPLLSLRGEVVGINTAIYSKTGGQSSGISFAIPSNMALRIASELTERGRVRRTRIGLKAEDALEVAGDPSRRGARITWVLPRSPSADAGLRRGDIVVTAGGEAIAGADALRDLVRTLAVGSELELIVVRGGTQIATSVRIADERSLGVGLDAPDDALRWAGLSLVRSASPRGADLGVGTGEGPIVARVEPGSSGARMGVLAGDRLVGLQGRPIADVDALRAYLQIRDSSPCVVEIERAGQRLRTILVDDGTP